jgi:serine/threonine protein kinase
VSSDPTLEETLFEHTLTLPEAERDAFLARVCGDDRAMQAGVSALLRAHAAADQLDRSIERSLQEELTGGGAFLDLTGAQLGPYRITARLGEGGTGLVYRAEQEAPIRRTVALKVIKPGMDTREVLARFAAERQTLALMDHPGIARVIDAGATPDGRGYFVMELVDGVPLTRYCDEQRLPLPARLELFLQVCAAVQHAHQKGVIHRDLKPSNLLITQRDGKPQPKIIDFGIAKATHGYDARQAAHVTQSTQLVGTPGYMSPEQVAGDVDLDTRSDIYSLGVLLHELFIGRTPHETKDWAKHGIDELRRRIREDAPPRPSLAWRRLAAADADALAAARATTAAELARKLAGDLDWITLRCLEKDRNRRYASAAALAEDLRRHREHEPVSAAAPGRLYLLGKSLRRHRLAYGLGAAAALTLAAATGVSLVLAHRARQAERIAASAAAQSQAVTDFLRFDVLAPASPNLHPDRELKLRTALDNAARKIGDRFTSQPLTEAAVRETLGETYSALGDYATAHTHFERSWELRRGLLGPDDRLTLQTLNLVVRSLRQSSQFDAADQLAGDALPRQRRMLGADDPITLETLAGLGAQRLDQGRLAEAEPLLAEALERRRRVLGPDNLKTLQSMNNLAMCYSALGRDRDAVQLFEESLALRLKLYGPEHPHTINLQNNLAAAYSRLGAVERSGAIYEEIYAIRVRVQGAEHPDTLNTLQNLGSNRMQLGQYDAAVELLTRARTGLAAALGGDHPQATMPLMNLGVLRTYQGRFPEAEEALRECLRLRTARLGPDHVLTTDAATQLGETLGRALRYAEGERILRETLERRTRVHGPDSFRTLTTANYLGCLLRAAGRLEEGDAMLVATAERALAQLGPDHPQTWNFVADALEFHLRHAEPARAESLSAPLVASASGRDISRPTRWIVEARRGAALLALGRRAEAEAAIRRGHEGLNATRQLLPANETARLAEVDQLLARVR